MVVITISTTDNPCTVFFDEPVPKADYVRLISCSPSNSWLDLKGAERIWLLNAHDQILSTKAFPPGHYTPKGLAKTLNSNIKQLNANLLAETNIPTGAVVITNPGSKKIQFSQNLQDFLEVPWRLETDAFIWKLKVPSVFFMYCDLVDRDQNLLNGEKTNLLAKFDILGEAFETVNYRAPKQQSFRAASTDKHVNSVTLSVKDENGKLFNFRGQRLYFELMII